MRILLLAILLPLQSFAAGKIINADIAASGTANIARNKLATGTAFAWCTNDISGFQQSTAVTASKAVASDANGLPVASATTATQLGFLSGATSTTGTVNLVYSSAPTLSNPIVGTQTPGDNSTKAASTAYADAAVSASNVTIGSLDANAANAQGLSLSAQVLSTQSADATHPGVVNNTTQTLSGAKTFSSAPTFSTMTLGSVLFAGTGGLVSQDNGFFFYDSTNHRVGIGPGAPTTRFWVKATADNYNEFPGIQGTGSTHYLSFYVSPAGDFYYRNGNLADVHMTVSGSSAKMGLAGITFSTVDTLRIRPRIDSPGDNTVNIVKLASQTGDFLRTTDTDGTTVLSKISIAGKGFFTGIRNTALSTVGLVHSDGSGDQTSSLLVNADITNSTIDLTTKVTGTLPVANGGTGITSLGTGVATFLGTPSSANLASAVTDESGSGALIFGTSPTMSDPVVGTQAPGDNSTKAASTAFVQAAITAGGGCVAPILSKTADYTITTGDFTCGNKVIYVKCGCTSACTLTLPAASNTSFTASIVNTGTAMCSIARAGSDTIYNTTETSVDLPPGGTPPSSVTLAADGGTLWLGL